MTLNITNTSNFQLPNSNTDIYVFDNVGHRRKHFLLRLFKICMASNTISGLSCIPCTNFLISLGSPSWSRILCWAVLFSINLDVWKRIFQRWRAFSNSRPEVRYWSSLLAKLLCVCLMSSLRWQHLAKHSCPCASSHCLYAATDRKCLYILTRDRNLSIFKSIH